MIDVLTLEKLVKMIADCTRMEPLGSPLLNLPSGQKIYEHPLMEDWKTEYYRGRGGYQYRWIVRRERQVRVSKALVTPFGTFVSPLTAGELRRAAMITNMVL